VFANSVVVYIFFGMNRHDLTNTQWERLQSLLPPQKPHTGRPAPDHRRLLNCILWIIRTGAPWRDLPERYGPWGTMASRFYRWRKAGVWAHLFAAVQQQADAAEQLARLSHPISASLLASSCYVNLQEKKKTLP
jgi:transposase